MYAKKVWNVNIFYYFPIMKHLGFFFIWKTNSAHIDEVDG